MSRTLTVTALLMTIPLTSPVAQDGKTVVEDASRAMGVTGVNSIAYSGSAAIGNSASAVRTAVPSGGLHQPSEPGPGQPVSPSIATLVENLERLKLDFDRHILVHPPNPDRPMTEADLIALAKKAN